jgi:hypothetical protein
MELFYGDAYDRLEKHKEKINSLNGKERADYVLWLLFNKNEDPDFRIEINRKNRPEDFKVGQVYRYRDDNFRLKTIEITFIRSSVLFYKVIAINDTPINPEEGKEEVMFDSCLRAELMEPGELDFKENPKYFKPNLKFNKTKINYTYGK